MVMYRRDEVGRTRTSVGWKLVVPRPRVPKYIYESRRVKLDSRPLPVRRDSTGLFLLRSRGPHSKFLVIEPNGEHVTQLMQQMTFPDDLVNVCILLELAFAKKPVFQKLHAEVFERREARNVDDGDPPWITVRED